jgi:CheY-like chemotaxis protein
VVTDVHMPRLDGLKLIHHIRSGARRAQVHPGGDHRPDPGRAGPGAGGGRERVPLKPVEPEDVSRAAASLLAASA